MEAEERFRGSFFEGDEGWRFLGPSVCSVSRYADKKPFPFRVQLQCHGSVARFPASPPSARARNGRGNSPGEDPCPFYADAPQRAARPRVPVSSDSSAVDIQAITFIYKYVSPNCGTSISLPMMRYSSVYVCVRACVYACERHFCPRRRVAWRGTRIGTPCRPETGSTNLVDVHNA